VRSFYFCRNSAAASMKKSRSKKEYGKEFSDS
jgi:hypothetical protein